jgi:hypothetical protein
VTPLFEVVQRGEEKVVRHLTTGEEPFRTEQLGLAHVWADGANHGLTAAEERIVELEEKNAKQGRLLAGLLSKSDRDDAKITALGGEPE